MNRNRVVAGSYPVWWDTTVTVYSKKVSDDSVVTWHRFVLNNCFWKQTGSKVEVGGTVIDTEQIVCRVPANRYFIEPVSWISMSDSDVIDHFTLQQGDIMVKGNCEMEIDEYAKGRRSTDLLAKYRTIQGCMEIKDVAINTMTGMVNPHYRVRGI